MVTNAIGQRAAGVVHPVHIFSTSRAVSPFFPSVQTVKGSARRASIFHRSLQRRVSPLVSEINLVCNDDTCIMIKLLSHAILAPVEVPKSGPLGSHFFAAKVPDIMVNYLFAYVRNV